MKSKPTYYIFSVFSFLIFIGMITWSCTDVAKENQMPKDKVVIPKPAIIKKPGSSYNDTLIVHGKAAVFYSPDSLQVQKIKQVNVSDVYATITHDCYYQMQNALLVIKKYWPKVKTIQNSKARYLLFLKADKTKICIDLDKKNDICGLFLFDGKQDPVLVDMPNIDTALGFYFKK